MKSLQYNLQLVLLLLLAGLASTQLHAQTPSPFIFETYTSTGAMNYQTSYDTAEYDASIVGFRALDGDIDEYTTGDIIQVYMSKGSNGDWYVKADFLSHIDNEDWEVDVLFTWRGLSEDVNNSTLSHQLRLPDIFAAGGKNLVIGDDIYFSDIDVHNTVGLYGLQDSSLVTLKLGEQGVKLTGKSSNLGIGTTSPAEKLQVNGNAFLYPGAWSSSSDSVRLRFGDHLHYIQAQYGDGLTVYDFNAIKLTGSDVTVTEDLHVDGVICNTTLTSCSDERYKHSITALDNSLALIGRLQGVSYQWRAEAFPSRKFDERTHTGFIAQDLEKVLPDMVHTDEQGYKSVAYQELIAVLVEAVKEQQAQITQLLQAQGSLQASLTQVHAQLAAGGGTVVPSTQKTED